MSTDHDLKPILAKVADGEKLTESMAEQAFNVLMSGQATPSQMGAFLMGLRIRGETIDEITGAARVMREKATGIVAPENAVDTCGTGGDGSGTYNISTGAAIVAAAAGATVAKHGNRAASSKSGSADVLMALGVNLDADMKLLEKALREINLCFMMATRHHSAMRHVMPTRVEMGTRTIFNLLGPLANPAKTKRQVLGVFAKQWVEPVAHVLSRLGSVHAWVVHGHSGLDEISTTGRPMSPKSRMAKSPPLKSIRVISALKPQHLMISRAVMPMSMPRPLPIFWPPRKARIVISF